MILSVDSFDNDNAVYIRYKRDKTDFDINVVFEGYMEDRDVVFLFYPDDMMHEIQLNTVYDIPQLLLDALNEFQTPCVLNREDVPKGVI